MGDPTQNQKPEASAAGYWDNTKTKTEKQQDDAAAIAAATAVLEREHAPTVGKKAEPVGAAAPFYGKRDEEAVEWPVDLKYLPRLYGVKATDIPGVPETHEERKAQAIRATKGKDAKAMMVLNLALQVFLELMSRHKEERQLLDAQGRKLFIDARNGQLTTRRFSDTLKDADNHALVHERAMHERSVYGVMAGVECLTAPGTPVPQPGHYKSLVVEHFAELYPDLFFLRDRLDPHEHDPNAHRPQDAQAYREYLKQQNEDTSDRRRDLLAWLPEFLKKPVCKWDGTV